MSVYKVCLGQCEEVHKAVQSWTSIYVVFFKVWESFGNYLMSSLTHYGCNFILL